MVRFSQHFVRFREYSGDVIPAHKIFQVFPIWRVSQSFINDLL
jgi:hypothetical protein